MLSVLDDAGMVFTRVWCCFELVLCRQLSLPSTASTSAPLLAASAAASMLRSASTAESPPSLLAASAAASLRAASLRSACNRRLGLGTYEMYTARPRCEAYDHTRLDEVIAPIDPDCPDGPGLPRILPRWPRITPDCPRLPRITPNCPHTPRRGAHDQIPPARTPAHANAPSSTLLEAS